MKNPQDTILIFKTDIGQLESDSELHRNLSMNHGISQWNIDHEDCDCVLRVVSTAISATDVIDLVQQHGFHCSELD